MTTSRRSAVTILIAVSLAACGEETKTITETITETVYVNPEPLGFEGTWVVCRNDGGTDYRELFTIAGNQFTIEVIDYTTADGSCDGDGVTAGTPAPVPLSLGADRFVPSVFGGDQKVKATEADIAFSTSVTFYSIVWRDADVFPNVLYFGDDEGKTYGGTAALRTPRLHDMPRVLQALPVASALTGTWSDCGPSGGRIVTFNANGTFAARKYGGPCDVPANLIEDLPGSFTLASPVLAQLGGMTVTAHAANLAFTAGFTLRTTAWVDDRTSPPTLYMGNDFIHGMNGSSDTLRPRVLRTPGLVKQ